MKKIIIPILLGFALVAVSCQKMLEIPQKGVIDSTNFYLSDADAAAALTDMYATFRDQVGGTEGIDNPEQVILNYAADDILAAGKDYTDHDAFRIFDEFTYDASSGTLKSCYQRYYYAIYHANLVISHFTNENRNGDEPKYTSAYTEQCVAEARVMRAYLHMMTALIWNQPPLMDRVYEGDELPVNDKTQSEILSWVISECQKAIASGKLPKRNGPTDKDATGRMSVGFAQFVAGKAAMFNNDPATARTYLKALIDSGDYQLIDGDDYWTLFHVSGDGNAEKIFAPNFLQDPSLTSSRWSKGIMCDRWMVANVFNWRSKSLLSIPSVSNTDGWGGGAVQEDFAEKMVEHEGASPRRLACFLTEDEFLYELEWPKSEFPEGTLEQMKGDKGRGLAVGGMFSHGKYFRWKTMSFVVPPKILTKGKDYPQDNIPTLGQNSNETNFWVARYAEVLLLYAEACIGADEAEGLKYLNMVAKRAGAPEYDKLTFENVMQEKQYELWFESCRFLDLVRWSKQGKVNLEQVYNGSGIHQHVPTVHDEFSEPDQAGFGKYHKFYTTHSAVPNGGGVFKVGKNEYLPFPRDVKTANPNLKDVLGWESNNVEVAAE